MLITENPSGGRWTYEQLKAIGLDVFGAHPFIDGKDCAYKLNDGLANELRQRDNIVAEAGARVSGGRGVRLMHAKPITAFNTKMSIPSIPSLDDGGKNGKLHKNTPC